MTHVSGIFSGDPPREVPLPQAPLVSVISQIRFPFIASIEKPEYIAEFQETIRKAFPDMWEEPGKSISVGPDGVRLQDQKIWRFRSGDKAMTVSLASGFVAFETKIYKGKRAFMENWLPIIRSVESCFNPSKIERIGLRYLNRLNNEHVSTLRDLVRKEILGILSLDESETIDHTMAETVLRFGEKGLGLLARWGLIGAGMTHDPAALLPIDQRSWILDIDGFSEKEEGFSSGSLSERLETLADVDYRFFRWAVTESFLVKFGGEI
jgi:uncharacterized protein (TIGR04255 family)